jgi:hypothetical protein
MGRGPSAWRALARAVAALRSLEPARVEGALQDMGRRRRWLAPLAYAGAAVAVVFDGILILLRHWQLFLLQVVPAAWIWVMTDNLRSHLVSDRDIPVDYAGPIAFGVLVVAQIAYWCNATFAFAVASAGEDLPIREAFRQARPHWRFISGVALLTGAAQAAVWLWLSKAGNPWFWLGLGTMLVVQIYMFVAVPSWIIGIQRKGGPRRDRLLQSLTTGVLSGCACAPGFALNRIGLLMLGIPKVGAIGFVPLAVGAALHVAGSSSARVVKMSVRLRGSGSDAPPVS